MPAAKCEESGGAGPFVRLMFRLSSSLESGTRDDPGEVCTHTHTHKHTHTHTHGPGDGVAALLAAVHHAQGGRRRNDIRAEPLPEHLQLY